MRTVWGAAHMVPNQKDAVKIHCFGDCGKISMAGVVMDDQVGGLFVCCQESCPYEQEVLNGYGETMSFGERHVINLRILKPTEEVQ